MKRVLVITYYWPPSGGAGVQRWLKFTKYLPEFGWQPIVITIRPEDATYPVVDHSFEKEVSKDIRIIKTPGKDVFRIYKKIFRPKNIPNAGFANEDTNILKQKIARFIRGNFFIPDPRKSWNRYAYRSAARILTEEKNIKCIITSSPPHSTQLIGLKLSKKFAIPWLADLRDPWTDIYYYRQLYPTFPADSLNQWYEKRIFRNAHQVLTVGPSLKDLFLQKHRIGENKIQVLYNGFDEDDFKELPQTKEDEFTITYVGTLSDLYPIETLIDSVQEKLKDHPGIRLRFVGSVSVNQRKVLDRLPGKNVEFINQVDHPLAIEYMVRSNVLLLVIPEHTSGKGIVTGKIFEYLASGTPILGIGPPDGDSARIIREAEKGFLLNYNDKAGLSSALSTFIDGPSDSLAPHQNTSYLRYSRKTLAGELAQIMNNLVD